MFIHLESIDQAGHTHSWGSQQYYDAVKASNYLLRLINAPVLCEMNAYCLFADC